MHLPLESSHSGTGVQRGDGAIGAHDKIGTESADVAAAALAVKRVGNQAEIFEHFEIQIEGSRYACGHSGVTGRNEIIESLEAADEAGGFEVEATFTYLPVEGRFNDDVRMQ